MYEQFTSELNKLYQRLKNILKNGMSYGNPSLRLNSTLIWKIHEILSIQTLV